jgi:secreted PhoX family phosphatase
MNKLTDLSRSLADPDDVDCNESGNENFSAVLNARLSRRSVLRGGMASAATALFGSLSLSACGGDELAAAVVPPVAPVAPEVLLGYRSVEEPCRLGHRSAGYTASVYALGDPLSATTAA